MIENDTGEARILPDMYVLPIQPKEYLEQKRAHCGAYAIKGVLSAYDRDIHERPVDYNEFTLGKGFGQMLPGQMVEIFHRYGVNAEVTKAGYLAERDRLQLLKQTIYRGAPAILLIGNGYGKNGEYSRLSAKVAKHWVTIYGYNDTKSVFYEYDPCVSQEEWDSGIPIGNKARTYEEVMRDWNEGQLPIVGKNILVTLTVK